MVDRSAMNVQAPDTHQSTRQRKLKGNGIAAVLLNHLSLKDKKEYLLQSCQQHNYTALMCASLRGLTDLASMLLECFDEEDRRAYIFHSCTHGYTALTIACRYGYTATASVILDSLEPKARPAYIMHENSYGQNALSTACGAFRPMPIGFLLESLDPKLREQCILHEDIEGSTALYQACNRGNTVAARLLVESLDIHLRQSYIMHQNHHNSTALLIFASRTGDTDLVAFLLDSLDTERRQPYILIQDGVGRTALLLACENGYVETAKLLLDSLDVPHRYECILMRDSMSRTSLSASFYRPAITRLLIRQLYLANISPTRKQKAILEKEFVDMLLYHEKPDLANVLQFVLILPLDCPLPLSPLSVYFNARLSNPALLVPSVHHLYHIICLLNVISNRTASFTKVRQYIQAKCTPEKCIGLTLLQSWCRVLDVVCDFPSSEKRHVDARQCVIQEEASLGIHMGHMDMDLTCFEPLTAALIDFIQLWHETQTHSSPPFAGLFWAGDGEFGSIIDILPRAFLAAFRRDLHIYSLAPQYHTTMQHHFSALQLA